MTTTRTSDSRGAPLSEVTTLGSSAFAYEVKWAYDAVGRLEEMRVQDTAQSLPLVEYDFSRDGVLMNEIVGSRLQRANPAKDLLITGSS